MNIFNKKSQNKGEWAETHVKLSLLGKLPINVIDIEKDKTNPYIPDRLIFDNKFYTTIGKSIYIKEHNPLSSESSNSFLMYIADVKEKLSLIEQKMKSGIGAFMIEEAEVLAKKLKLETACTPGNKKSDLTVSFKDGFDGQIYPLKEVSIKAFIGSNPTILNASINSTKLKINLGVVNEDMEKELLALQAMNCGARKNLNILKSKGFSFENIQFSESMEYNLNVLNAKKYLVNAVLYHFTKLNREKSLMKLISEDPMIVNEKIEFEAALKKLLRYSVTGMNPATKLELNKKQTDLMLLVNHDFTHDILSGDKTLEHYLYENCYLDVPSQSRHRYGFLYKENESWFIDLNFQIRMQPIKKEKNVEK